MQRGDEPRERRAACFCATRLVVCGRVAGVLMRWLPRAFACQPLSCVLCESVVSLRCRVWLRCPTVPVTSLAHLRCRCRFRFRWGTRSSGSRIRWGGDAIAQISRQPHAHSEVETSAHGWSEGRRRTAVAVWAQQQQKQRLLPHASAGGEQDGPRLLASDVCFEQRGDSTTATTSTQVEGIMRV